MYVLFDNVDHDEFESEEKTGNGSSFVRHFDEKLSKMAINLGGFPHICRVVPCTYFVVWKNYLHHVNNSSVANKLRKRSGASPPLSGDNGP